MQNVEKMSIPDHLLRAVRTSHWPRAWPLLFLLALALRGRYRVSRGHGRGLGLCHCGDRDLLELCPAIRNQNLSRGHRYLHHFKSDEDTIEPYIKVGKK